MFGIAFCILGLVAMVLLFVRLDERYGWTDPDVPLREAFWDYKRRDR